MELQLCGRIEEGSRFCGSTANIGFQKEVFLPHRKPFERPDLQNQKWLNLHRPGGRSEFYFEASSNLPACLVDQNKRRDGENGLCDRKCMPAKKTKRAEFVSLFE